MCNSLSEQLTINQNQIRIMGICTSFIFGISDSLNTKSVDMEEVFSVDISAYYDNILSFVKSFLNECAKVYFNEADNKKYCRIHCDIYNKHLYFWKKGHMECVREFDYESFYSENTMKTVSSAYQAPNWWGENKANNSEACKCKLLLYINDKDEPAEYRAFCLELNVRGFSCSQSTDIAMLFKKQFEQHYSSFEVVKIVHL